MVPCPGVGEARQVTATALYTRPEAAKCDCSQSQRAAALGWTQVEIRHARDDLTLYETWAHPHTPLSLLANGRWREPFLVLSMQVSGRSQVLHPEHGPHLSTPEKWSFFRLPGAESASRFEDRPGTTAQVVSLTVTAARLQRLLDGQPLPAPIRDLLAGRFDPSAGEVRMSAALKRILQQIRANPYQGAMGALYLEGKIFEMLAETLTAIAGETEATGRVGSRERRAALAARDRLMADLANPPSIEALARDCGLSQRRLTALFQELFGATPFQCVARWRLDRARHLLVDGALTVKQIAHLTGYAHVSSFTHAYARHFGAPPAGSRSDDFS